MAARHQPVDRPWHRLPGGEVSRLLGMDPSISLTAEEVARRQRRFGPLLCGLLIGDKEADVWGNRHKKTAALADRRF